jgi:cobalt-zinc-cadmium efflux system membrane fusion protein
MSRTFILLSLVLALGFAGCEDHAGPHDHSVDHPAGHDHHEERHGHGDTPTVLMTLWGGGCELFAEHNAAVVGEETSFLLHVTVLDGFYALEEATVTLELDGPTRLRGQSSEAIRPGIFRIEITAATPGLYRGRLLISEHAGLPGGAVVEGITMQVFASFEEAEAAALDHDDDGLIEFLKEQQWGVPFFTAFAENGVVLSSIEVSGRVETPGSGTAEVGAPVTGSISAPAGGLPRPGAAVIKGQVLASLVPASSSPEQAVQAGLVVAEATARLSAARTALERAERLIRDGAISQREVENARREARVAEESASAAQRNAALYAGAEEGKAPSDWPLVSPIDGVLVSVEVHPGAIVSPGQVLFRIIDLSELWIVARVPEQDAMHLRADRNASYQIAGLDAWLPITLGDGAGPSPSDDEAATASIVTIGHTVDPQSRTVDVIYALYQPDPRLRVGALLHVSLPTGGEFSGVVVPRTSLVDIDGRSTVYVQVDGEHFQERLVRTGPRSGDRVAITSGLRAGERVVTTGAHLIRLADKASGEQAHGHIH